MNTKYKENSDRYYLSVIPQLQDNAMYTSMLIYHNQIIFVILILLGMPILWSTKIPGTF